MYIIVFLHRSVLNVSFSSQGVDDPLERGVSARESSSDLYREYQKQRKILQVPHHAEYCATNSVLYVILEFTAFL